MLEELRNLLAHVESETGEPTRVVGLALSSRKNLCIHPEVSRERDGKVVDARCHSLVAPHVRERRARGDEGVQGCDFYEQVRERERERKSRM